jgi:hypothetical protein
MIIRIINNKNTNHNVDRNITAEQERNFFTTNEVIERNINDILNANNATKYRVSDKKNEECKEKNRRRDGEINTKEIGTVSEGKIIIYGMNIGGIK